MATNIPFVDDDPRHFVMVVLSHLDAFEEAFAFRTVDPDQAELIVNDWPYSAQWLRFALEALERDLLPEPHRTRLAAAEMRIRLALPLGRLWAWGRI